MYTCMAGREISNVIFKARVLRGGLDSCNSVRELGGEGLMWGNMQLSVIDRL